MNSLVTLAATSLAAAFLVPTSARANVGEVFGFGSRTAALGGAGVAWGAEGYSAYSNPAILSKELGGKRFVFSYGMLGSDTRFIPIQDVVVENDYTSDKTTPRKDDVDTDYPATIGQKIGLIYQFGPELRSLSFGVTAYLPLNHLASFDTGETYVPEYFLYRSRTQRPQFNLSVGMQPSENLAFGAGIQIGYTLTANGNLFLQGDTDRVSTMKFASTIKPKASPFFGGRFTTESGGFTFGSVLRFPLKSASSMKMSSGARLFGDLAALDFQFKASSALYYDPLSFENGVSIQYAERARLLLQLDYQAWSKFKAPSLFIDDPEVETCENEDGTKCSAGGLEIASSAARQFDFRDIVIPRIGHELTFAGGQAFRLGYAFKPSILKHPTTGAGNYLDPPKHIFTVGYGTRFNRFLGFEVPFNLDLFASYHQLVTQTIVKTEGDEEDQGAGDRKIGAPGYKAGGHTFSGGVSLTVPL